MNLSSKLREFAIVEIIVPHFRSIGAYADPTHKRFFTTSTFDYFEKTNPNSFYMGAAFKVMSKRISFSYRDAKTTRAKFYNIISKPLELLSNINPQIYDKVCSHILPPCEIIFKLKVIK